METLDCDNAVGSIGLKARHQQTKQGPNMNIKGIDKAKILAALFNASKHQGLGFLDTSGARNISVSDATEIIATYRTMYFDYLRGRVMKVDISGDDLDTALYNRDNGAGAAERALDHLAQEAHAAYKDGNDRHSTKIVAENMQMLGGCQDGGVEQAPRQQQESRPAQSARPAAKQSASFDDVDDLPF